MHEITTAVHFLHARGCFHRDIRSANIWLSDDYTAHLMDYGLAKFVPIISNDASTTSAVVSALSPFGTREYMCPEYLNNPDSGHYEAAYDVYSVGVVMVELILGSLVGAPSSRDGSKNFSVFRHCVQDNNGNSIMNGFELLKAQADRSIIWESESLDLVCKTAIRCLTPPSTPMGTMKTIELLAQMHEALRLNAPIKLDNNVVSNYEFIHCQICDAQQELKRCHFGHAVCSECIESKFYRKISQKIRILGVCPAKGCTSHDGYLYGYLAPEVIELYLQN
jgi:serine/threonine protein kinase